LATKEVILSDEVEVINQDDQVDINLDIPSDEKEVINQAMLLDDPVDTDLDTPMDLLLKNEFFQEKYLHLTAKDIQLENLTDTNEDISMVDQPGIEPEMLLDIDEDTASDTDMDDASTSECLEITSLEVIMAEDYIDDYPMLNMSAIKPKIVVVSPGPKQD